MCISRKQGRRLILPMIVALCTGGWSNDIFLNELPGSDGALITGNMFGMESNKSVAAAGDFNGDGNPDYLIGSPNEFANGLEGAGAAYVVFGTGQRFTEADLAVLAADPSKAMRISGNVANARLGAAVACAGDFNGDGLSDILIAANPISAPVTGVAYLIYGRAEGFQHINVSEFDSPTTIGIRLTPPSQARSSSITGAGDVNNDGYDDFVFGMQNSVYPDPNRVAVVFGRAQHPGNMDFASFQTSNQNGYMIIDPDGRYSLGAWVAPAGDFNGDGFADFLCSSKGPTYGSFEENDIRYASAIVVLGKANDFQDLTIALDTPQPGGTVVLNSGGMSSPPGGNSGSDYWLPPGINSIGDLNGDGYSDLVIAFPDETTGAEAMVVLGSNTPHYSIDLKELYTAGPAGFVFHSPGQRFVGKWVSSAGDFNGDGRDDVLMSAIGFVDNEEFQLYYLLYGQASVTETISLPADMTPELGLRIDYSGMTSTTPMTDTVGDMDKDGYSDIIISFRPYQATTSNTNNYVIWGREENTAVSEWALY